MKLFSLLPRRLSHFACNSPFIISRPASPAGGQNPEFSPPKPLQIQKTAIFRPFLVFLGLEKAAEGIWWVILGSSGKFRSQDPVPVHLSRQEREGR